MHHLATPTEEIAGADPRFDQGGPQIMTSLKLPFWGLSFVEFWCWGLIFGGQGGPRPLGPPLDLPLHRDGNIIQKPTSIIAYNHNMGRVDRINQQLD